MLGYDLQAVHSGEDLQSAADAVMGYDQVTMKGKAIKIAPVPGVATARLQSLLSDVLKNETQVNVDKAEVRGRVLAAVQKLIAVRLELLPALQKGNQGCADRFRWA